MVVGLLLLVPLAQATPPLVDGPVLAGRVVDAAGEPVPGAEVGVGCSAEAPDVFSPFELLAEAQAGEGGAFRLELPAEWLRRQGYRDLVLFARGEGHGLLTRRIELREMPLGSELELRLPAEPGARIRIVDAEGLAVEGARAVVTSVAGPQGLSRRLPIAWSLPRAAATDADGWARLPVPLADVQRLRVIAPGHVEHVFALDHRWPGSLPPELPLSAAAEYRIDWGDREPPDQAISLSSYRAASDDSPYVVEHHWEVTLEGRGPLLLRAPAGPKNPSLAGDDVSALLWSLDTEGSASGDVLLARPEPYTVRGRVVDARSGEGVAGVRLGFRGWPGRGWVVSDADGSLRFEAGAPAGWLEHVFPPAGYRGGRSTEPKSFARPEGGGEVDLGEIALDPTEELTGRITDEEGAPVAGAWVVALARIPGKMGTNHLYVTAVTDEAGRFALEDAPVGLPFELTARHGDAEARGSASAGEELELLLVRRLAARGRLVDEEGAPVAGARVELWRESQPRTTGGERRLDLAGREHVLTGPDGAFETPAVLEPAARYALRIEGEDIESPGGEWVDAESLAQGLELRAQRRRRLEGVLRAPDGAPLPAARLRLRRAGAETLADEQGRFALEHAPPAGDVLVVHPPEGLPHARLAVPGEPLDWRLSARGELRRPEPAPPAERALELQLALELLEAQYEEALEAGEESPLLRAVQDLAWADPAGTLERVESGIFRTGWMRSFSLSYVADALREESPEEALAVGRRIPRGMSASLSALRTARHLSPRAEREQLALSRAEARGVDPPEHRLVVLAQLADRLLDLGEHASAASVLEEGRAVAASLPPTGWPGYARCRFAEVLSRVDYPAARALIDELADDGDRDRHLGNTAQKLAAADPERAEELLGELGRGTFSAERFASRVAHAMAPVDLERARGIARRHDRSGFSDGMIALALIESGGGIAHVDHAAEARASLETAFRLAGEARRPPVWNHEPGFVAAALLPVAEKVEPRGLETWVARALAIPRPSSGGDLPGETLGWLADAALAFHLARWDRELARALLEPAVQAATRLGGPLRGHRRDVVWAAAVAIDPEWAAQLAREHGGRAAARIGLLLAMPPEQRTAYVQDQILRLWIVGKEDL